MAKKFKDFINEQTEDTTPATSRGYSRTSGGASKRVTYARVAALHQPTPDPISNDGNIIDLSGIEGNTGTVTTDDAISKIIVDEGKKFELVIDGTPRIVGNDLFIVPSGVIDAKAGDVMLVVGLADGVSQIVRYQRAAGESVIAGAKASGWIQFNNIVALVGQTKDFNGITVNFVNDLFAVFPDVDAITTFPNSLIAGLSLATDPELTGADYTYEDNGNIGRVYIVAKREGTAMNSYTLTGGTADFTASGSTLSGGIDPPPSSIVLLSSTVVDCNVGTKQALYTVPEDKACIVTQIILRNATADISGMGDVLAFGFNAGADDWPQRAVPGAFTPLMDNTTAVTVPLLPANIIGGINFDQWVAQKVGTATDVFGCLFNDDTIVANLTIDVFGYLIDA